MLAPSYHRKSIPLPFSKISLVTQAMLQFFFIITLTAAIHHHSYLRNEVKRAATTKATSKPSTSHNATISTTPQPSLEGRAATYKTGKPPPPLINGLKFLGYWGYLGYWIGTAESTKNDAQVVCDKISTITGTTSFIASATSEEEANFIENLLAAAPQSAPEKVWINQWVEKSASGKVFLKSVGHYGATEEEVTGTDLFLGGNSRKRSVGGLRTSGRVLVSRAKRQMEEGFESLRGFERLDESMKSDSITQKQVHYPWLASWKQEGLTGPCKPELSGCKPRNCTVTTEKCAIVQKGCKVEMPGNCTEMPTNGCTAVCSQCNVTQPECFQLETKCKEITPRKCEVTESECTVVTPPCTITRNPCVTKHPPCRVEVVSKPCEVSQPCGKYQGATCRRRQRRCTEEELNAGKSEDECFALICDGNQLCLKPTYCREENIICPYPITFCPAETVRCETPEVRCSQPITKCTEPVFDCPVPQLRCFDPIVKCSSPQISCPNVVTKCGNSKISCEPPEVICPKAKLECDEPEPCVIPPYKPCPPTPVTCEGNCNCIKLQKLRDHNQGKVYGKVGALCAELLTPLCSSNTINISKGGK